MSRFVMVSFLFMGWTFYELSGGAGFSPPIRPEPIAIATATAKRQPIRDQHVTAASLVTKPVIQPRQPATLRRSTAIAASQPARPAADPEQRSRVALAQIAALGETSFGFGLTGAGTEAGTGPAPPTDDSAVQLASLSGGLAPLASSQVLSDVQVNRSLPRDPVPDLRQVTASRVNMRGGPGTLYPVVTKLNRDTAVEVLKDSGTGWLHLRVVEDDQTGWIAASLISKKRP
ncbi:SH3 domain-containing protein [Parasedimentitalea psychrophila]|uniref:SH3 domain-containing protein n=1 Tax=Parasedimentitalea psychrophila TaxID=2997337 RepID=A0A9Y2P7W3_9RHOB|nr:SH3 domain-containing protein [Parasedimentitalea psychrophila]WIY26448.1 SH3 domain-containing protein [Parasedimentitalea psychrophila]